MTEILTTILLSSFKFAMTFPLVVLQFRLEFWETILWTNIGGFAGILFFAFLSKQLLAWWARTFKPKQSKKRIFTKRNRRIVRIKKRYGLAGIALSTPILLSIPIGVFLAWRYYRNTKLKLAYLAGANFLWSVIYTLFYTFFGELVISRA